MPVNGTRRWYMSQFGVSQDNLYRDDYFVQTNKRMLEIFAFLLADGVQTLYVPLMGADLYARGEAYMRFAAQGLVTLVNQETCEWYQRHQVEASCYGEPGLLPPDVQDNPVPLLIDGQNSRLKRSKHQLRFGIFADLYLKTLGARVERLKTALGRTPDADDIVADYYGGPLPRAAIWIGGEQPTVFDVPFVADGQTALYFLQFPTLYLTVNQRRQILYDLLFVRGGDEELKPEISGQRWIMGLGKSPNGAWQALDSAPVIDRPASSR